MTKTDLELAAVHKYVVEPGGKPVIGVTSVNVLEKQAFKWTFATVASATTWDLCPDYLSVAETYRETLQSTPYGRTKLKKILAERGERGEEEALFLHFCRGECQRQWDAKAALGTRVHDHALDWAMQRDAEVLPDEEPYMDALEKLYAEQEPEMVLAEVVVGNPVPTWPYQHNRADPLLAYGGRFDWLGRLKSLPGITLMDYKTGGEYLDSTALQLVAYGRAAQVHYDKDGMVNRLVPLPHITNYRTCYLQPDGEYRLVNPYEVLTEDDCFATFLHLRAATNWQFKVETIKKAKEKDARNSD